MQLSLHVHSRPGGKLSCLSQPAVHWVTCTEYRNINHPWPCHCSRIGPSMAGTLLWFDSGRQNRPMFLTWYLLPPHIPTHPLLRQPSLQPHYRNNPSQDSLISASLSTSKQIPEHLRPYSVSSRVIEHCSVRPAIASYSFLMTVQYVIISHSFSLDVTTTIADCQASRRTHKSCNEPTESLLIVKS